MAGRSSLTIRGYRDGDEPLLVDLMREMQSAELPWNSLLKAPDEIGPWYAEKLRANCVKWDGQILFAEVEGKPIGCAVVYCKIVDAGEEEERPHSYALIGELVVAKSARRTGAGKALLEECDRRARAAGTDRIHIGVLAGNVRAREVYRAAGFTELGINMWKSLA
jgi:ribosomal protein S18 acetylase RimI-like enzyme